MTARRGRHRMHPWIGVALAALPVAHYGCSAPTSPAAPPGGGSAHEFNFALFQTSVEPVLNARGCDAVADCHGGGIRGTFALSPPGAKDAQFDFEQASLQVSASDPDGSPLLTEPLAEAAGGTPHGFKPFNSTADSGYVAIRSWILDGVTP